MSYLRMPVFCWTSLASNLIILAAFPVLTVTLALLMLDRYLGFHFFTNDGGGNSMLYMNLIWVWGHPRLHPRPAGFGIYSEVAATFSGKPCSDTVDGLRDDGHLHRLADGLAASFLHDGRWREHQCGIRHRQHDHRHPDRRENLQLAVHDVRRPGPLHVPIYYLIGFMLTFRRRRPDRRLAGHPPVDFVVHNSLFLVAHFHHVIIGGVVFAIMAGYTYWFPKAFGFTLDERLGKAFSGAGSSASISPSCRSTCSASGARHGGCSTSPIRPGRRG
jgi:cytochrome o ubiquinol oxidase subunit 1